MKSLLSKISIVALIIATSMNVNADSKKQNNKCDNRAEMSLGPGPVTAISYNYSQLPSQVRNFVSSNYRGQKIEKITFFTLAGKYKIEFKNDAEIMLNKDCKIFDIDAAKKGSISKNLLQRALPDNAVRFLVDKKLINHVEEFKLMRNGSYKIQTDKSSFFGLDKKERTIYFDRNGNKVINVKKRR